MIADEALAKSRLGDRLAELRVRRQRPEGDLIEARGEVVRAGGSMVFVRGLITTGERPIANFSAIVKKVRRKG